MCRHLRSSQNPLINVDIENKKYIENADFHFKGMFAEYVKRLYLFSDMTHGNYCQIFDISEINFVHYIFSQKNETLKGLFLFSKFREQI